MKFSKSKLLLSVMLCIALSISAFAQGELITSADATSQTTEQAQVVYSDVPADASYAESMYKLTQFGVLNGYPDGTARPEGNVTRAEIAKMICLTFGFVKYTESDMFPDVTSSDWYYPYVLAIEQHRPTAIDGRLDGKFYPNDFVTREEMCKMVGECTNLFPLPDVAKNGITDTVSDWAKDYVARIVNNYLMPLEANDTFRATENAKRYEVANLLAKFLIEPVKPLTAEIRFFVGEVQYGETDIVVIGDTALPPEIKPVPENGYAFMGWQVKGTEGVVDVASMVVTEDVDYEAVFAKLYTVTFYNGDVVYDIQLVPNGKFATKPIVDPKFGDMEFSGWYLTNESVSENEVAVNFNKYPITKDTNFYARYTEPDISDPGITKPVNPNSEEMMEKLNRGYNQLVAIPMAEDKKNLIEIRDLIAGCVDDLITDANEGNLITKSYVDKYYGGDDGVVEYVKYLIGELKVKEATELSNLITNNVDKDVRDFMQEYFDINPDNYV